MRALLVRLLFCMGAVASIASSYEEAPCKRDDDDDEAACSDRCDEIIAALRQPLPAPASTVATCTTVDEVVGCACREDVDDGDTFFVNGDFCASTGRLGDCLVPPDSFPGCSLDDAGSCDDVCALFDRQRSRDAAALDVTLVDGGCDFMCACSIGAGDRCATFELRDQRGSIDDAFISPATCSPL